MRTNFEKTALVVILLSIALFPSEVLARRDGARDLCELRWKHDKSISSKVAIESNDCEYVFRGVGEASVKLSRRGREGDSYVAIKLATTIGREAGDLEFGYGGARLSYRRYDPETVRGNSVVSAQLLAFDEVSGSWIDTGVLVNADKNRLSQLSGAPKLIIRSFQEGDALLWDLYLGQRLVAASLQRSNREMGAYKEGVFYIKMRQPHRCHVRSLMVIDESTFDLNEAVEATGL